jgi:hypothetical protein
MTQLNAIRKAYGDVSRTEYKSLPKKDRLLLAVNCEDRVPDAPWSFDMGALTTPSGTVNDILNRLRDFQAKNRMAHAVGKAPVSDAMVDLYRAKFKA